jgi:hypothetical protein
MTATLARCDGRTVTASAAFALLDGQTRQQTAERTRIQLVDFLVKNGLERRQATTLVTRNGYGFWRESHDLATFILRVKVTHQRLHDRTCRTCAGAA